MINRKHINLATGELVEHPPIRPFADWLHEQSAGETHDELSEALWGLVGRVQATQKKGSLTLTIKIEPTKSGPLMISDEIRLRLPEYPRDPSIAYIDSNGNLTRNNPLQPPLTELRDASATPTRHNFLGEVK